MRSVVQNASLLLLPAGPALAAAVFGFEHLHRQHFLGQTALRLFLVLLLSVVRYSRPHALLMVTAALPLGPVAVAVQKQGR